jgi:predicted nucleotidyltransferase
MSLFEELIEGKKKDKQIVKSFETKETLSDQIFEEKKGHFVMRDEIKKRLLEVSNDFIESLGVEFFIHDVVLTGSLANYNWSQYSDVDLHILIDFEESKYEMDILKEFFDAKKNVWNEKHDIKNYVKDILIFPYDPEVNKKNLLQDIRNWFDIGLSLELQNKPGKILWLKSDYCVSNNFNDVFLKHNTPNCMWSLPTLGAKQKIRYTN